MTGKQPLDTCTEPSTADMEEGEREHGADAMMDEADDCTNMMEESEDPDESGGRTANTGCHPESSK